MKSTLKKPAVLAASILCALAAALPLAAQHDKAGDVAWLRPVVTETLLPDGPSRPMQTADPVRLASRIETGPGSEVRMTFGPSAVLELGPEDQIVIDRLTVDEVTGRTEGGLSLLVGRLRLFVSRLFGAGEVEIGVDTPTAALGVKGTVLEVDVDRRGDTVVWVLEGQVEVRSKAGGPTVEVAAGEVTVVRRGEPATDPAPFDPKTGATASGALPPPFTSPPEELQDSPTDPLIDNLPPRREPPPNRESGPPPP